jgi:tape measure domain-containing protein
VSVVANVAVNVDARNANQSLRDIQGQAEKTERSFGRLTGAVSKLATAFAGVQTFKFVFGKTAEIEKQSRSLEVLTGSAQKAGVIIKELQRIGAVTPFTSTELIDSAKRLQAFGVETEKVVETTRRLADVSGATGAELQGLVTAYGQVQAKGRLQGEELLQFQERGVALQKVLKEEYRLSGEEFQKALSKGQISAEAVEYAIQKLTNTGGKYANGAIAQSDTLSGRLSTLQDGIEQLARTVGTVLSPAIKAVLNQAIQAVDTINQLLAAGREAGFTKNVFIARQALNAGATSQAVDNIAKGIEQVSSQKNAAGIEQNLQALQKYQRLLQSIGPDDPNAQRAVELQGMIFKKIQANLEAQKQLGQQQAPAQQSEIPALMQPSGADKAAKDAKKLADELARSLKTGEQLFTQFSRQAVLTGEVSEIERQRLQIQYDYQDRADQIAELKNAEQRRNLSILNDDIKRLETRELDLKILREQLEIFEKIAGLDFSKTEGLGEIIFGKRDMPDGFADDIPQLAGNKNAAGKIADGLALEIKKLQDDLNPIKLATETITQGAFAIGDAFSTAFGDVITGAKSTQEALADAFASIGEAFISMALEIIAKQMTLIILQTIFNALSGISSGTGIEGTEGLGEKAFSGSGIGSQGFTDGLDLMPGLKLAEGGYVTSPTSATIGEGSSSEYVIPESKMSSAMSRWNSGVRGDALVSGAEPTGGAGGVALAEAPTNIVVEGGVLNFNDSQYIRQDQVPSIVKQASAAGEAMALRKLQMSTATRRRLGL